MKRPNRAKRRPPCVRTLSDVPGAPASEVSSRRVGDRARLDRILSLHALIRRPPPAAPSPLTITSADRVSHTDDEASGHIARGVRRGLRHDRPSPGRNACPLPVGRTRASASIPCSAELQKSRERAPALVPACLPVATACSPPEPSSTRRLPRLLASCTNIPLRLYRPISSPPIDSTQTRCRSG